MTQLIKQEGLRPLVLASASPRRQALLQQMGLTFEVRVTDVDEGVLQDELPARYVERLAVAKARAGFEAVCESGKDSGNDSGNEKRPVVIGADTIVSLDDEILGKPCGQTEGIAMLLRLSGRAHEVLTGVAAYDGEQLESCVVVTTVHFRRISADEAAAYWQTGEPIDKAGGYGIQGIGGIFAERLEGSYSAVVGLPVEQTEKLLRLLNIDTWSTRINGRRTPN
jgi:septum formation protein